MFEHIPSAVNQITILFLLMGAGCLAAKARWMNQDGAAQMTKLVHFIATPCVIIHSFLTAGFSSDMLRNMGYTALFSIAAHLFGILAAHIIFRNEKQEKRCIYKMCASFSNCAFMGIPLVGGILGEECIVYISVYIAVFNLFTWTYGAAIFQKEQKLSVKNMLLNPGTVSLAAGLLIAALQLEPPSLIREPVRILSAINSPVAMIILGYYFAVSPLRPEKGEQNMWIAILLKLVLLPGMMFGLSSLFGINGLWVSSAVGISAMPCAVNVLLFAARYGKDTALAARTATYCTVLSMFTMPLFLSMAGSI